MRFKKGSRVEVLKKCEVPWGCWWCGTILSGNGRYYQVMYDRAIGGVAVEIVLRKDMRPMPPPVGGLDNLVEGDIVEVFHCNSWKAATVTNPVDGFHFFVRLLGASCLEFSVHKTYVRLRQSWHDDQWFVVGMDHWDRGRNKLNNSGCVLPLPAMKRVSLGANCNLVDDYTGFPNEGIHGSSFARGSLKRRSNICLSYINRNLEPACKVRTVEDICQRLVSHQLQQPEKVDTVVSPHIMLGKKSIHASYSNKSNTSTEADMEESTDSNTSQCFYISTSLKSDEAESRACSVVSYSNSIDSHSDDADSSSSAEWGRGRKCFEYLPVKEEAAGDHTLELHAYRSTMEALYASGPISWEQEEMITNLRLTLNISNDEHLLELSHLFSNES